MASPGNFCALLAEKKKRAARRSSNLFFISINFRLMITVIIFYQSQDKQLIMVVKQLLSRFLFQPILS